MLASGSRLIGATMATLQGGLPEDERFLGGRAGGLEEKPKHKTTGNKTNENRRINMV